MAATNTSNHLKGFFGALALLALLAAILSSPAVVISPHMAPWADIIVTIVFVSLPILALFIAAGHAWTPRLALCFLVPGALLYFGTVGTQSGPLALVYPIIKSIGLICWCLGLGALLATLLKEKNLVVPVAIFLALLDMCLVLTPIGLTHQIMAQLPKVTQSALYDIPKPRTAPPKKGEESAPLQTLAEVGPADFIFLSMFFVALYRFKLRTRQTLFWILPVLACYLLVVMVFGRLSIGPVSLGALPALLPIGATVLLVNWKEFDLDKEEKLSTALIAIVMLGVLCYGMSRWPAERARMASAAAAAKP